MTPQHLQHQDAHHHAQLAARLHGAAPRSTGLLQLHIDVLALQEGRVSLPSGAAIMPLGECVSWHETLQGAPASRALPDATAVPTQRLEVYLVLGALRLGDANVADDARDTTTCRYLAQPARLPELTKGATPELDIMLAQPHLRLAFAHELQEGDCRLHLMTLIRLPHGGAQVDVTFLPQSLRLQPQGELVHRLQALHDAVRTAEARLRPQAKSASLPATVEAHVHHRGLVQLHGALADLLGDPLTAPIDVYRQLRACLPWLSPPLPPEVELPHSLCHFDHTQPAAALWPLIAALDQAVATEPLLEHLYPVRQMAKSGLYIANLAPWPKQRAVSWFLHIVLQRPDGVRAEAARAEAEQLQRLSDAWLRLAKVSAPSQMPRLIRSALRGIALRPADAEACGPQTAPGTDALLFALDTADASWPQVESEGDIVLLPPPVHAALPLPPLKLTLICRPTQGGRS